MWQLAKDQVCVPCSGSCPWAPQLADPDCIFPTPCDRRLCPFHRRRWVHSFLRGDVLTMSAKVCGGRCFFCCSHHVENHSDLCTSCLHLSVLVQPMPLALAWRAGKELNTGACDLHASNPCSSCSLYSKAQQISEHQDGITLAGVQPNKVPDVVELSRQGG